MAKLVYSAITSLDGYIADASGNIDWAAPDPEVHGFINGLERDIGIYLYGRKMYEAMVYWETFDATDNQPQEVLNFTEIWRAAAKVVYSRTLGTVTSDRTRIERLFDPAAVLRLKESARYDLSVGGPELAGQAMTFGLVDEMHLFVTPVTIGGGTPALPKQVRQQLELMDVKRFRSGVVHLHYRIRG